MERREKTRAKLVRSALVVFASHGVDARVIDLVIKQAGVARGTFYNYFRTNEELFIAVAEEVSSEIIRIVDPLVVRQEDPAARIACGVSSVIRLASAYPIFAEFVVRGGPAALSTGSLTSEVVPRDIHAGVIGGRFHIPNPQLAFDLIVGPVISAFYSILTRPIPENYAQDFAQSILQSLGVERLEAQRISRIDFGPVTISEDSIFQNTAGPESKPGAGARVLNLGGF